jgi:uncharacterized protein (TIGR04255 family)
VTGEVAVTFERPPLAEVAIGVQFRPLTSLRAVHLGVLWERWREDYPILEEQPPLEPTFEQKGPIFGSQVQLSFGPPPMMRHWFLNDDGSRLLQVQRDRLVLNWRRIDSLDPYPRYEALRDTLLSRLSEFTRFIREFDLGSVEITQSEINYINAIEVGNGLKKPGQVELILNSWKPSHEVHHLGEPEEVRITQVFPLTHPAGMPARLYVSIEPAQRQDGEPFLLLTFTVRGSPPGGGPDDATAFLNFAHAQVVQSFTELTTPTMQKAWGRTQ